MLKSVVLAATVASAAAHGHLTVPSSRNGGELAKGGECLSNGACFWFSNNVEIPGPETLPYEMRSVFYARNGTADVYKTSPWRAPGTAPVYGSGCGVAGGSDTPYNNGGLPPAGIAQGADAVDVLPPVSGPETIWHAGDTVEVAWAISANHGGGYSYRLCPADGEISEECFQRNQLKFAGDQSWVVYPDGTRKPFTNARTTDGTFPAGSEWARDPIPGCNVCDPYEKCGSPLPPVPGANVKSDWSNQVFCYSACDANFKTGGACDEGTAQFPEPLPGISGFGKTVWEWSVADAVVIPEGLAPGKYLLGWRWDTEESTQVWENCADVTIVAKEPEMKPRRAMPTHSNAIEKML